MQSLQEKHSSVGSGAVSFSLSMKARDHQWIGQPDYKTTAQYLCLMEEDGVWKNEEARGQVKIKKGSKKAKDRKKKE